MKRFLALLFCSHLIVCTGCYQRNIAPEVTYDESRVETLDQEIKKLEWD